MEDQEWFELLKFYILCYLCTMEIFNIFITLFSAFFIAWTPNQLLLIGLYTLRLRFFHLYLPIIVWFQCFAHALSSNLHVTHERCTLFYLDFGLWFRTWFWFYSGETRIRVMFNWLLVPCVLLLFHTHLSGLHVHLLSLQVHWGFENVQLYRCEFERWRVREIDILS